MGGWVMDETNIMQCHILTDVGVEVEDELGKKEMETFSKKLMKNKLRLMYAKLSTA